MGKPSDPPMTDEQAEKILKLLNEGRGSAGAAGPGETSAPQPRPGLKRVDSGDWVDLDNLYPGGYGKGEVKTAGLMKDVGDWLQDKASQMADALDLGHTDLIAERQALARREALRRQAADADNKKNGWFLGAQNF